MDRKKLLLVATCLFMAELFLVLTNMVQAQTVTATYTTVGGGYDLDIPEGATSAKVEAWGGGGGGGVGVSAFVTSGNAGGGGGGGYGYGNINNFPAFITVLNLATGGAGGDYSLFGNEGGRAGGTTDVSLNGWTFIQAYGGYGGGGTTGGNGSGGAGGGAYAEYDIWGSNGYSGGSGSYGGAGGGSGGGSGGGNGSNGNGSNGFAPGGGGSGGRSPAGGIANGRNGGNGARGEVRITITFPAPVITSATTQICGGGVELSVVDPVADATYIWYKNGVQVATGETYDATAPDTYTVRAQYTFSYRGGSPSFSPALGSGNTFTTNVSNSIVVTNGPTVLVNPITLTGCTGSNFNITPVNGTHGTFPTGTSYKWEEISNTGVDNVTNNNITGSTTIALGVLENTTNAVQTVVYNVTPTGGGCEGTVFELTVNVKPKPQIGNVQRITCSGQNMNITLMDGADGTIPNGTTYSWVISNTGGVGGATNGNGSVISLGTLLNTSGSLKTIAYTVTPNYDGCAGVPFMLEVEVNPALTVSLISDNTIYCTNGTATMTVSATPADNYEFDWYRDGVLVSANGGETYNQAEPARTAPYNYYVIARSAFCEGVSNVLAVTSKNKPTATVSVNRTDICPGGSITAKANVLPVGNYIYTWTLNGATIPSNEQQIVIDNLTANATPYEIVVNVATAEGYSGCETSSNPVYVTVHKNPKVTLSTLTPDICEGASAVITSMIEIDPAVSNTNHYTYQWAVNGVIITNAIQSTYSQVFTIAGTYSFSMRMIQNNDFGCASDWSDPVVIKVEQLPQVSLMVNNDTYCAGGGNATLTAAVFPTGNYVFDWYKDNVLVLANGGNTFTSSETARSSAYNYHVVARSLLGCSGKSEKVSVFVKPLPTVSVITNHTDICPGGSITARANVLPSGNYTYSWYLNGNMIGNEQQITVDNLSVNTYSMFVKVAPAADYNGCEVSSTPININVYNNPVVTIAADNNLICDNGMVTLSVTGVALNAAVRDDSRFTYQWAVNGIVIENATRNTYSQMLEAGEYEFTARVIQNNNLGCASDWSAPVTVVVMSVEVPPFFTTDCNEENIGTYRVVFLPINVISGNPQIYSAIFIDEAQWYLNFSGVISDLIEIHLPLQAGDYKMEIDIDGCKYKTTGRVMLDSYALGGVTLITKHWDDVLTVNNNPENNGGFTFYSYQWYKNGVLVEGANKQYYVEPDGKLNGEYYVVLNGYAILENEETIPVSLTTCPYIPTPEFSMSISPVPAKQNQLLTFNISLSAEELAGATLEIYNMIGMLQQRINNVTPQTYIQGIGVQGVYFARLILTNGTVQTIKFIIR